MIIHSPKKQICCFLLGIVLILNGIALLVSNGGDGFGALPLLIGNILSLVGLGCIAFGDKGD